MRTARHGPFLLVVLLLGLTACASTGSGGDSPERGGRNLIVEAELMENPDLNALEAIQRLRPQWLRQAMGRSPVPVLNGTPQRNAGVNVLRSLRAGDVERMRYLSASDATTRYGTGFDGGAIVVETRRGGGGR